MQNRNCTHNYLSNNAMKLLLLVPNFILMLISGYNLSENRTVTSADTNYVTFNFLHILVLVVCTMFVIMIVKSMFRISYVNDSLEETESYEAMNA